MSLQNKNAEEIDTSFMIIENVVFRLIKYDHSYCVLLHFMETWYYLIEN